jgi:hypothetical protein
MIERYDLIFESHILFLKEKLVRMNKDVSKFFSALLRSPGMNEDVKITMKLTRRDILLLDEIIEIGVNSEELKGVLSPEWSQGLKTISGQLLEKAEISEEFMASYKDSFGLKKSV